MMNQRQKIFLKEYLLSNNVYQSAIKAGYSHNYAKSRSHELLDNVGIKQALDAHYKAMEEKTGVTIEKIVAELSKIAFSNITDVVEDEGQGLKIKPLSELEAAAKAAVSELSEQDTMYGKTRKVKMHSKITALQLLGQHLGMFSEKAPAGTLPPVTDKDETEH